MMWLGSLAIAIAVLALPPLSYTHPWQALWFIPGAASLFVARGLRGGKLRHTALLLLSVCAAQYGAVFGLASAFARYHRLGGLSLVFSPLVRALGYDALPQGDILLVRMPRGLQEVAVTTESLAIPLVVVMMCSVLLIAGGWRPLLRGLALCVAYVPVRYVVLLSAFVATGRADVFWRPDMLFLSFVPLCLGLERWVGFDEARPTPRLGYAVPALVVLAGVSLGLAGFWEAPGTPKVGRILVDEAHSDWERTDKAYTTTWYGEESGYNYYCLYRLLGFYYGARRNYKPITDQTFRDSDILILKTPTSAYSPSEVRAIRAFVRRGGGLLLVGDHTNVFGMNDHLNQVAEAYGIRFNFDATYDLDSGSLNLYRRLPFCAHPATLGFTEFLFGSSCSLSTSPGVRTVMLGTDIRTVRGDYSRDNFFPDGTSTANMEHGVFVQAAAATLGKGRVFAFSDSTVWSNFWLFLPGKSELLLGACDWLNRRNGSNPRFPLLAAAIVALLLARPWRTWGRRHLLVLLLAGGTVLGVVAAYALDLNAYPKPWPRRPLPVITFDLEHSKGVLPSTSLLGDVPMDLQYHTFFVWMQRLGFMPRARQTLNECIADGMPITIARPTKMTREAYGALRTYVARGGVLLLLTTKSEADSIWWQLAESGQSSHETSARRRLGRGTVYLADAERFSNESMGHTGVRPSDEQMRIYEEEFGLVRRIWRDHGKARFDQTSATQNR